MIHYQVQGVCVWVYACVCVCLYIKYPHHILSRPSLVEAGGETEISPTVSFFLPVYPTPIKASTLPCHPLSWVLFFKHEFPDFPPFISQQQNSQLGSISAPTQQPWVEQHFPSSICSLCVFVSHFAIFWTFFIFVVFAVVICGQWSLMLLLQRYYSMLKAQMVISIFCFSNKVPFKVHCF